MKDANDLLVAQGPEGFVRTWGRLVSEASAKAARTKSPSAPGAGTPVAPRAAAKEEEQSVPPALVLDAEGTYVLHVGPRVWRVKGLSAFGVDRLRVNLRVDQPGASGRGTHAEASRFHVDTFDLYSARSRQGFVESAVRALRLDESDQTALSDEVALLIEGLEKERLSLRHQGTSEAKEPVMSATEREEALAFLKGDVVAALKEDFRAVGCVGEETALLTGYLALVSRKLAKPLSVLFCARSGAGKSMLQDRLAELVPPEDLVKYTRISGQALFYKDENALRHKLVVVEEEDGAASAAYALRSLISSGVLRASVTRTDPRTGRQVAEDYVVNGPVTVFLTSAHPEVLDYESRNRFVLLTVDESREQTRRILAWQRFEETAEGLLARHRAKAVQRKHHNAQRLLEPLEVVIPLDLPFPETHLILRREQKKYQQLVKAIALLHQHQRPRKAPRGEGGEVVEYIEVTEQDVAVARELSPLILDRNLDELSPPTRALLLEIERLVEEKRKAAPAAPGVPGRPVAALAASSTPTSASTPSAPVRGVLRLGRPDQEAGEAHLLVSRQEIQKATGLSYWHVRTYIPQLVEYEYLTEVRGRNGRTLYRLLREGEEESEGEES
ncbi:hypothetical protein FBQ97_09015 [Acidobacteria bacterium ACD]|nr:hypothetical protein [Acidobacteria bacterium ACD]